MTRAKQARRRNRGTSAVVAHCHWCKAPVADRAAKMTLLCVELPADARGVVHRHVVHHGCAMEWKSSDPLVKVAKVKRAKAGTKK